jgi:diaminopimelate epimerase
VFALGETVDIVTDAGVRAVSLRMADDFSGEGSVEMGVVTLSAHNDPRVLAVAHVGNPHVVVSDDPSWTDSDREALADELGPGPRWGQRRVRDRQCRE